MDSIRNNERERDTEIYSPGQVESVLIKCNIEVISDTGTNLLALCPLHGNTNTPALSVDKATGLFICFSPSCGEAGTLLELVEKSTGRNPFQAQRLIFLHKNDNVEDLSSRIHSILNDKEDYSSFSQKLLDRMHDDFWTSDLAKDYMHSRGFNDDALEYFKIGFSEKQKMIVVPMHDIAGKPIGIIGRTASGTYKRFKNSKNLPKSKTLWNIHRAKRNGETVIVCESSYDAIRIHQSGFPNVVALLGGHISEYHIQQIAKYFKTVVIFTDMDPLHYFPNCRKCNYQKCKGHRPGRDLGRSIEKELHNKKIMWACYSDYEITPNWVKDASDMEDDQIRQCINNAKSKFEYTTRNLEAIAPV